MKSNLPTRVTIFVLLMLFVGATRASFGDILLTGFLSFTTPSGTPPLSAAGSANLYLSPDAGLLASVNGNAYGALGSAVSASVLPTCSASNVNAQVAFTDISGNESLCVCERIGTSKYQWGAATGTGVCGNPNITIITANTDVKGLVNAPIIQFRTNATPPKLTRLGFTYWYAYTNGTGTGTLALTDTVGTVLASVNYQCTTITSAVSPSSVFNVQLMANTDYQIRETAVCATGGGAINVEAELQDTSNATIWTSTHQYVSYGLLSRQATPTLNKTIGRFRTGNGPAIVPTMSITAFGDSRNNSSAHYQYALTDEVGTVLCSSPSYLCSALNVVGPFINTVNCGNASLLENTEYQLTVTSECLQTDGAGTFTTAINVVPTSTTSSAFSTTWGTWGYTLTDTPPTSIGGFIGTFHTGSSPMYLTALDTAEAYYGAVGTGTAVNDFTDAAGTVLCSVTFNCSYSGRFSDWVNGCRNVLLPANSTFHWKARTGCGGGGFSSIRLHAHVQNSVPVLPWTKLVFFGDSITAAQGTSFDNAHGQSQHSYATVLSQKLGGLPVENWGVPGDQAGDADQVAYVHVDGSDNVLYNIMIGANDQRWYANLDANQRQLFKEALADMVHWLGTYSTVNHATYSISGPTPNGGCGSTNAYNAGTGKMSTLQCGNSTPVTITINNLTGSQLWFSSQTNTPSTSTYSVTIDGVSSGTFTTNTPGSVALTTVNGLPRYSRLLEFTGLANTTHTVAITSANIGVGSSNSSFFFQWVGSSGEYRPRVKIVLNTVTTQAAGFGWGGSAANLALYNADIRAVCAQAQTDNINCVLADTNSATDVNDTFDGIHLTNNGHNKVANYLYPFVVAQ